MRPTKPSPPQKGLRLSTFLGSSPPRQLRMVVALIDIGTGLVALAVWLLTR